MNRIRRLQPGQRSSTETESTTTWRGHLALVLLAAGAALLVAAAAMVYLPAAVALAGAGLAAAGLLLDDGSD